jgi:hypothetical protein
MGGYPVALAAGTGIDVAESGFARRARCYVVGRLPVLAAFLLLGVLRVFCAFSVVAEVIGAKEEEHEG